MSVKNTDLTRGCFGISVNITNSEFINHKEKRSVTGPSIQIQGHLQGACFAAGYIFGCSGGCFFFPWPNTVIVL
jgi:hypothetical protein